jgi:hypothetical protein
MTDKFEYRIETIQDNSMGGFTTTRRDLTLKQLREQIDQLLVAPRIRSFTVYSLTPREDRAA